MAEDNRISDYLQFNDQNLSENENSSSSKEDKSEEETYYLKTHQNIREAAENSMAECSSEETENPASRPVSTDSEAKSNDPDSLALDETDSLEEAAIGGDAFSESSENIRLSELDELFEFANGRNRPNRGEGQGVLAEFDNAFILQHLLMGQDDDLLEMFHNLLLDDEALNAQTTYPVGDLMTSECLVCYNVVALNLRTCCSAPICAACLRHYFETRVSEAQVKIPCPNFDCGESVHRDEILDHLSVEMKVKFNQFLVDANREPDKKTCPRCSSVMTVDLSSLHLPRVKKFGLQVECVSCALVWCFPCQAPWHEGIRCKEYRRGDKLVKTWARERPQGQINAQRCPNCKVFIQRSAGCDHMTCSQCNTHFCYQCGEKFREFKFIGNHYSRLSIFGCKYLYQANSPAKRKLVRGSIFGAKLLAAPVLGGLALGAGAVVAGIGLMALPFYGGYRLHRKLRQMKEKKIRRSLQEAALRDFNLHSTNTWNTDATPGIPDTLPSDRFAGRHNFNDSFQTIASTTSDDYTTLKELDRHISILMDQGEIMRASSFNSEAPFGVRQHLGLRAETAISVPLNLEKGRSGDSTGSNNDAAAGLSLPPAAGEFEPERALIESDSPSKSEGRSDSIRVDLEVPSRQGSKCFEIFI